MSSRSSHCRRSRRWAFRRRRRSHVSVGGKSQRSRPLARNRQWRWFRHNRRLYIGTAAARRRRGPRGNRARRGSDTRADRRRSRRRRRRQRAVARPAKKEPSLVSTRGAGPLGLVFVADASIHVFSLAISSSSRLATQSLCRGCLPWLQTPRAPCYQSSDLLRARQSEWAHRPPVCALLWPTKSRGRGPMLFHGRFSCAFLVPATSGTTSELLGHG